jgi:hypothetical protein
MSNGAPKSKTSVYPVTRITFSIQHFGRNDWSVKYGGVVTFGLEIGWSQLNGDRLEKSLEEK